MRVGYVIMTSSDRGLGLSLTLALLLGLASVAIGLTTLFADLDADSPIRAVSWLSYALGATCMVLSMLAGLAGRHTVAAMEIFLLGAVGVAIVPLFWFGVAVAVLMVVGAAILDIG